MAVVLYQKFLKFNGTKQITSAPHHPSTIGLAERAVQIIKQFRRQKMDLQEFC